eukprot:jgi/Chlat1/144/Chrsp1S03235
MVVECPSDECWEWTAKYFADCVCTPRDRVSFFLGLTSIICWGVAELPQIVANYRLGKSEGVSLAFIMTWTVGDIFNLIGCYVSDTLPTQFYTAVLYTTTTIVLVVQHLYYNHIKDHAEETWSAETNGVESPTPYQALPSAPVPAQQVPTKPPSAPRNASQPRRTPSWTHHGLSQSQSSPAANFLARLSVSTHSPRLRAVAFAALLMGGALLQHPAVSNAGLPGSESSWQLVDMSSRAGRKLLQVPMARQLMSIAHGNDTAQNSKLGWWMGWAMTGIYLTGRLPQILLNISRGSVEGLSISMFLFAIGGNATYLSSILVRSLDYDRLRPNIPWIIDSAFCLVMDFFIFGQYVYYTRKSRTLEKYGPLA